MACGACMIFSYFFLCTFFLFHVLLQPDPDISERFVTLKPSSLRSHSNEAKSISAGGNEALKLDRNSTPPSLVESHPDFASHAKLTTDVRAQSH